MLMLEIAVEFSEERRVQLHLPALDLVPCAVWRSLLDAVINPTNWNFVCDFVVQDGLEWRYDLQIIR